MVADGKLSHEDYLKLAPNKGMNKFALHFNSTDIHNDKYTHYDIFMKMYIVIPGATQVMDTQARVAGGYIVVIKFWNS